MGTITKGILGGFSGKVGTVIGGNWKGIDYMRSKANRRKFTATEAQVAQQIKFGLSVKFLQSLSGLVDISFRDYAVRKTGFNSALSYTLRNAITGTYPNFSLLFSSVLVSRGDLPNIISPAVTSGAGSVISFSWTDNSQVGAAKATDKALLAAYCPALQQSIYTTGSASRDALTDNLNLLPFSGQQVHTWIGFISEDGLAVANSYYTGMVVVS